jgi:hypothetical protein
MAEHDRTKSFKSEGKCLFIFVLIWTKIINLTISVKNCNYELLSIEYCPCCALTQQEKKYKKMTNLPESNDYRLSADLCFIILHCLNHFVRMLYDCSIIQLVSIVQSKSCTVVRLQSVIRHDIICLWVSNSTRRCSTLVIFHLKNYNTITT